MSTPFPRTLRALDAESLKTPRIAAFFVFLCVAGWLFWAGTARFPVSVTSTSAQVVAVEPLAEIQSAISGPLTFAMLSTSRRVEANEVVARLDTAALEIEDKRLTKLISIVEIIEVPAARSQVDMLRDTQVTGRLTAAKAAESRAQLNEIKTAQNNATTELKRLQTLLPLGVASQAQVDQQNTLAQRLEFNAQRWQATLQRAQAEDTLDRRVIDAEIAQVETQIATLKRTLETLKSEQEQNRQEIEKRTLRSPIAGTLNAPQRLRPGVIVAAGQTLATVVPDSTVEILATYDVRGASGRIAPGQLATLKLDALPWTRHGVVEAVVREVSQVHSDGQILVRCNIMMAPDNTKRHGLVGTLEIEIDRATPLQILIESLIS